MYTIVAGDVENGFKLFGLFRTATDASRKARAGHHVVRLNPPGTNPHAITYPSIDEYVEAVHDDRELAHAVVSGRRETGFRFLGPFYEEDAEDAVGRAADATAAAVKIRDASEL